MTVGARPVVLDVLHETVAHFHQSLAPPRPRRLPLTERARQHRDRAPTNTGQCVCISAVSR